LWVVFPPVLVLVLGCGPTPLFNRPVFFLPKATFFHGFLLGKDFFPSMFFPPQHHVPSCVQIALPWAFLGSFSPPDYRRQPPIESPIVFVALVSGQTPSITVPFLVFFFPKRPTSVFRSLLPGTQSLQLAWALPFSFFLNIPHCFLIAVLAPWP